MNNTHTEAMLETQTKKHNKVNLTVLIVVALLKCIKELSHLVQYS
jgi:hypothetical protein